MSGHGIRVLTAEEVRRALPMPEAVDAFYLASGWPSTGLYETTDGGQTWASTGFSGEDRKSVV